jgi:hypothetical protein
VLGVSDADGDVVAVPNRSVPQTTVRNLCAEYGLGFRLWSQGSGQLQAREVSRTLAGTILATGSAIPRKVPLVSIIPPNLCAVRV